MDRFIGGKKIFFYGDLKYLKSNMDRFIVRKVEYIKALFLI